MTDRVKGCWVAFDKDYREDDVVEITNAIRMIKGVKAVKTKVTHPEEWMNRTRVQLEMRDKIFRALEEVKGG